MRAFNGSKVNDLAVPQEARQWLTDELWALLAAIRGDQAAKKRITVIELACAAARQQPRRTVFAQADTCAERTWYTRWQHQPAVEAALAACCARALAWAEQETVAQAMHDRRQRRQTTAQYAAQAPAALAAVMADPGQRSADRIRAAQTLMAWADAETAASLPPAAGGEQGVYVDVTVGELAAIEAALRREAAASEEEAAAK